MKLRTLVMLSAFVLLIAAPYGAVSATGERGGAAPPTVPAMPTVLSSRPDPTAPALPTAQPVAAFAPTAAPLPTATPAPLITVRAPQPRVTRMMVLGDSVSAPPYGQWGDEVANGMGWLRVNQTAVWGPPNGAIPGSTLQAEPAAVTFFPAVTSFASRYTPVDQLFIYLGTNDFGYCDEMTPASWTAAWDALYAQIAALPAPPAVHVIGLQKIWWDCYYPATPPGWSSWAPSRDAALATMDAISKQEALSHHATFTPIAAVMDIDTMYYHAPNGGIDIHPGPLGQRAIADAVLATLRP